MLLALARCFGWTQECWLAQWRCQVLGSSCEDAVQQFQRKQGEAGRANSYFMQQLLRWHLDCMRDRTA